MVGAGAADGRLLGNIFAVISASSFALMLVTARKSRKTDVLTGNFLGALFAIILMGALAITIGKGLTISPPDLMLSLGLGAFTIGVGIAFVARGAPWLPAANVGVLVLLESVMSPVWVWVFLGIPMESQEITGGLLVLTAVMLLTLNKRRRHA
jgi:drug/metabolite transporter (DMT)-like permease